MTTLFPLLMLGEGLLFAALAVPLIQRRVPPNYLYGFRTPKTLGSEEIWYDANAYVGRDLLVYGLFMVAAGGLAWAVRGGLGDSGLLAAYLAVSVLPLLILLARAFRYLSTL